MTIHCPRINAFIDDYDYVDHDQCYKTPILHTPIPEPEGCEAAFWVLVGMYSGHYEPDSVDDPSSSHEHIPAIKLPTIKATKTRKEPNGLGVQKGGNRKLTYEQAQEIRVLIKTRTRAELAYEYGISKKAISHITAGRTYNNKNLDYSLKMTYEKAQEIRRRFKQEDITRTALAKEFGVSNASISRIILNQKWVENE